MLSYNHFGKGLGRFFGSESSTYRRTQTCNSEVSTRGKGKRMFTAALFEPAKNEKQSKRPSTGEQISNLWYAVKYNSALKINY